MTPEERFNRLDQFIAEGRLIRRQWREEQDGRELACLLAALAPECGEAQSSSACPADLLPWWFAEVTPWIDDAGTQERWPVFVQRYAVQVRRPRTEEQWRVLRHKILLIAVREAMSHTKDESALGACETVCALHERAVVGDYPSCDEWDAAAEAAAEARDEARAEAAAAWAAAAAAWAAAEAWAEEAADRMIDALLTEMERQ